MKGAIVLLLSLVAAANCFQLVIEKGTKKCFSVDSTQQNSKLFIHIIVLGASDQGEESIYAEVKSPSSLIERFFHVEREASEKPHEYIATQVGPYTVFVYLPFPLFLIAK